MTTYRFILKVRAGFGDFEFTVMKYSSGYAIKHIDILKIREMGYVWK